MPFAKIADSCFLLSPVPGPQHQERYQNVFLPLLWLSSWRNVADLPSDFKNIKSFLLFVGFPRSGHSILGAMLDGHRHMMIAHELNALALIQKGFKQKQIFNLIVKNSDQFVRTGRGWSGNNYALPGQYQGRSQNLLVIGDKKGGTSNDILEAYPGLLKKAQEVLQVPLKVLCVMRHPLDNIATMAYRRGQAAVSQDLVDYYFKLCEGLAAVKRTHDTVDFLDVYYEDLFPPRQTMIQTCHFLGVDAEEAWLKACDAVFYPRPQESRLKVQWPPQVMADTLAQAKHYPFLKRYLAS